MPKLKEREAAEKKRLGRAARGMWTLRVFKGGCDGALTDITTRPTTTTKAPPAPMAVHQRGAIAAANAIDTNVAYT